MRKELAIVSLSLLAVAVPAAAQGNAQGTPQRSAKVPPGLAKNFARMVPGLIRAIVATEGSNSRLQELPVSP